MSRRASALGAVAATVLLTVGVPVVLLAVVGNPWPGRTRLELGDEVALVVGVLAVLVWLVWLRFVVAVVAELRAQIAEMRRETPAAFTPPPSARQGSGLLAQRLVAMALVLLPIAPRPAPAGAVAPAPATALVVDAPTAAPATASGGEVTVVAGDTLYGLARRHLGDAERWREIFQLNRDRSQPDGGRLSSPSLIRPGWVLTLPIEAPPAVAAAPYLAPATVTIEPGDTLWSLAHERLEQAGVAHDDVAVAGYVHTVVAQNGNVIADPNLIHAGERIEVPAIGSALAPSPAPVAPAATAPAAEVVAGPKAPPTPSTMPPSTAPPTTSTPPTTTPPTTSTTDPGAPPVTSPPAAPAERSPGAPSPIGVGEAAVLSAGVLALLASRRRARLRASRPHARVPEPPAGSVAAERRLRTVDAGERLARVDVAVRAAAAGLLDSSARIALVRAAADGAVELTLTADAVLPPPWHGGASTWTLPGQAPVELLADAARSVGAPCIALTQLGIDAAGGEVLADLEALGLLAVDAPPALADTVLRGIAATLAASIFAEAADLVGVGIDEDAFLDHRHAHAVESVDSALELAATLVGTTATVPQSTFVLRARHTSGEAWEPAVVLVASTAAAEVDAALVRTARRCRSGVAMVVAGAVDAAPWTLAADGDRWVLEPSGVALTPVGLSADEVAELHGVLSRATDPLVLDEPAVAAPGAPSVAELPWTLMVRLLGPVEVADRSGTAAVFERSKALELIAWLTLHRDRSTRAGARTALWELDVRDATFANVVSEARRTMARLAEPPDDDEWLGRTMTEVLPLHPLVVADVDVLRCRLDAARLQPPEQAIATLRPAVELIRDMPFASTGYLWPDAEGITSNLVLLATSAATELAGHALSMGDVDGVFWATGQGLKVLPGHEDLIALRMRAHANAGDLSGVRQEWECYERVLHADPWGDGEPAAKLVLLRRQLLST